MSAHPHSSEKPSIWSPINAIIGVVIAGIVLLWVTAFVFKGLGSLRPKEEAKAAAPVAEAAPAATAPAPAAEIPVLEVTIKPDSANRDRCWSIVIGRTG